MKKIEFINSCKVDESWMPNEEVSFRENANDYIAKVISKSNLFTAISEIKVSYFQEGVGSIVAKIEQVEGTIGVFKMIKSQRKTFAEILSYKKYNEIGILTPKIYETGEVGGYPYYIMEYFDTPTYRDLIDRGEVDISEVGEHLGKILFQFETIPVKGFGIPEREEGDTLVAQEVNTEKYLQDQFNNSNYAELNKKYLDTIIWTEVAFEHIKKIKTELGDKSVLGNFDFGPRHFFAEEEAVLFDPDAELVPEYFSAAFYCSPEMGYMDWQLELRRKVMSSYKEKKKDFDKDIFTSVLWLLVYRKCFRLLSLPNEKRVARARHMLHVIADLEKLQSHVNGLFLRI
jgi:hypothetical protein